jgi:hypothetical protein
VETFCGSCKIDSAECIQNIAVIANNSAAGNFTWNQIVNNSYGITKVKGQKFVTNSSMDLTIGKITFKGPGKYTMFMPYNSNTTINGLIVYYHPTIFGNYNSPSFNNSYWRDLGIFYASQNFILLLPH